MGRWRNIRLVVSIVIAIAMALILPSISIAGSLEPSTAPAPTMKTLDQIPPTWSQRISCVPGSCPRFQDNIHPYTGVLDRETGLVWQKDPPSYYWGYWYQAQEYCNALDLGGRIGWRLPTLQELATLVDTSIERDQTNNLPSGHPFRNVHPAFYWSATTFRENPDGAWGVYIGGQADDGDLVNVEHKSLTQHFFWCVRGGQGVDPQ